MFLPTFSTVERNIYSFCSIWLIS